jgi:hypothetical protein
MSVFSRSDTITRSYSEHVSYQLAGNGSTGISKVMPLPFQRLPPPILYRVSWCTSLRKRQTILLQPVSSPHITPLYSSQPTVHFHTALTPWIALVSCDKNATNASMGIDIFTLARDKGAVAAVCIHPGLSPLISTLTDVRSLPVALLPIFYSLRHKFRIFRPFNLRPSFRYILDTEFNKLPYYRVSVCSAWPSK